MLYFVHVPVYKCQLWAEDILIIGSITARPSAHHFNDNSIIISITRGARALLNMGIGSTERPLRTSNYALSNALSITSHTHTRKRAHTSWVFYRRLYMSGSLACANLFARSRAPNCAHPIPNVPISSVRVCMSVSVYLCATHAPFKCGRLHCFPECAPRRKLTHNIQMLRAPCFPLYHDDNAYYEACMCGSYTMC